MGKLSSIGDVKSPVGDNKANWGWGIFESGKADSENKSTIPNLTKKFPIGDLKYPMGILYPIGYFLLLVL